jgi:S1-C subfamily serine protease
MDQLVKTGKVTRGFIGVGIQDVTPELAREFKLTTPSGVLITRVDPNKPGAKAGLQVGDVVTQVEGTPVTDTNSLRLRVSRTAPGSTLHVKINRNGTEKDVPITLTELETDDVASRGSGRSPEPGEPGHGGLEGVAVEGLTPEVARELKLEANTTGVVVTDVAPDSAAAEAGLRQGDVIQQVNRRNVTTVREFDQVLRQSNSDSVLLLVNTRGATHFLVVKSK